MAAIRALAEFSAASKNMEAAFIQSIQDYTDHLKKVEEAFIECVKRDLFSALVRPIVRSLVDAMGTQVTTPSGVKTP